MRRKDSVDLGVEGQVRLVRAQSWPDEIAQLLRGQIQGGTLKPGDRLPTEQQLCRLYGVSRPVVREAISQLRSDGVLESFQGRGVFVRRDAVGSAFRLEEPNLNDQRELEQILELLITVEVAATGLAAERRTRSDLKSIKNALEAMAKAIDTGNSGVDEDFGFHRRIVEAADNPYFVAFTDFLEGRVRYLIRAARTNTARFEGLAYQVQEEHDAIFGAIAERDPEAAKKAAERHLRNAAARLKLYRKDAKRSRAKAVASGSGHT